MQYWGKTLRQVKKQRVLHREITIHFFLSRAVELFDHTGFGISTGGKMTNVFSFHQGLKGLVVQFFPVFRLQFPRFPSIIPFQNLLERCRHVFSSLGLDGFQAYLENTSTTVNRYL